MGRKRPKQGSSSSVDEDDMAASKFKSLQNSIDGLNKVVTDGFANIHTDIDNLRFEFKTEIEGIKSTIKDIERGLETTKEDVESVKEDVKKVAEDFLESTNTLSGKIVKLEQLSKSPEVTEALNAKIVKLETQLKQQEEENIRLEQYTRRENLRFNNISEIEDEDCKSVIQDIIQQMGIDSSTIRYHAVHRVGRRLEGRHRPIIVRFVSREDRELVWSKRGKIKQLHQFKEAYITEDYARAIQNERQTLIKAMMKARNDGMDNVKVVGRFLVVNGERFDCKSIPDNLM